MSATTDIDALRLEVKQFLIKTLQIPDMEPEQIGDFESLFENEALNLDSLDAAEIAVHLHSTFGPRVNDLNLAREVLYSVDSIAQAIVKYRQEMGDSSAPA
jgi:acyl carrier protein